jgi:hypothetical protein
MSFRKTVALASIFLAAVFANATSRNSIQIKVLDSETHSVNLAGGDVPKNCDQVNFDAYCNNSRTTLVTNILLVQEGGATPFRVACTVDSRFSRCTPLPKGETYEAKKGKHSVTVYYVDDKGKARSQAYTLVDTDKTAMPGTAVAAASPPTALAPAPPSAHAATQQVVAEKVGRATVKCNFTSVPPGAEISLDGKYVGSTPSEIALSSGPHVIVFSVPGFVQWKRDLNVMPGSELTVSATMVKESR